MKTKLAILEIPGTVTKKLGRKLSKRAQKRLGRGFRVLLLTGGMSCKIVDLSVDKN